MSAFRPCLYLFVFLVGTVGCSNEPFPMVNVEGKITYEDGTLIPAESVMIRFLPQVEGLDEKTHARPGTTFAEKDGTFKRVTTHKANDGLVRGRHKVLVKAGEAVPAKYLRPEETPLEVDTKDAPFHLKVQKPE